MMIFLFLYETLTLTKKLQNICFIWFIKYTKNLILQLCIFGIIQGVSKVLELYLKSPKGIYIESHKNRLLDIGPVFVWKEMTNFKVYNSVSERENDA